MTLDAFKCFVFFATHCVRVAASTLLALCDSLSNISPSEALSNLFVDTQYF